MLKRLRGFSQSGLRALYLKFPLKSVRKVMGIDHQYESKIKQV